MLADTMPMYAPDICADQVFILRFWREQVSEGSFQWRAQVSHVNTRERMTSNGIEAALSLIASRLEGGFPDPERNPGPR